MKAWCTAILTVFLVAAAPLEDIRAKKHPAPSGNPQDYATLLTYVWPNPKTPDGMPWVHRDGETNPQTKEYDRPRLNNTVRAVATLGLMAYNQEGGPHAARAVEHLRGWFIDPITRMNPHLRFAPFIPGQNEGSWHGIMKISVVVESYFFDAVNLLHRQGALDKAGWLWGGGVVAPAGRGAEGAGFGRVDGGPGASFLSAPALTPTAPWALTHPSSGSVDCSVKKITGVSRTRSGAVTRR